MRQNHNSRKEVHLELDRTDMTTAMHKCVLRHENEYEYLKWLINNVSLAIFFFIRYKMPRSRIPF